MLMTSGKLMDWSREPLPKVAEKVECITSHLRRRRDDDVVHESLWLAVAYPSGLSYGIWDQCIGMKREAGQRG